GPVAQLVEQGTFNPKVAGSNPARPIEPERTRKARASRDPAHPRRHEPRTGSEIPRSVDEDVVTLRLGITAEDPNDAVSLADGSTRVNNRGWVVIRYRQGAGRPAAISAWVKPREDRKSTRLN